MKKMILFTVFCISATLLFAQQPTEAEMKAMMKSMTPGDMQAMMAMGVGDWKAEITMWMDPTQPPAKQEARVKNEMILGGRYLCSKYTGSMMGMPFEGLSTTAYDNGTGKFYSTWIDNMSTGMTQMTGSMNMEKKTLELKGISQDPMTGKEIKMRQVITFIDDKTQKMEMYMDDKGKEVKNMEIMLTKM